MLTFLGSTMDHQMARTSCLDGWYGNDCSLKCNCAPDSRCDVYTGKCEVCSLGYVPPYCLKASPRNIFDVTSVHDVKNFKTGYKGDNLVQGRIHVGKNARGFLLKDQHNSQIVPSAISSQLLLCDISDQELCTWKGFTVPSTSVGCPNDRPWRCKGSTHCIPWSFVCDYFANDCQAYNGNDSSDQIGCGEKPVSYDDFACPVYDRDRWAPASWMCDGQVDCTDGRDEIDCPVNKLNTMGQEVVSPVLNLSAAVTHQCLAIAFKLAQKSSNAPLALLAKLPDESTVPLMSIDSHESGWYIQNFNISLQAYSKQAIRLVLKKTNNITIEISRISACSNNDEDVEILPPVHTRSENLTSMQIYNIFTSTWEPPRLLSDPTKTCVNGGVLTTAGCACAPGFTGLECREGCGSNKFGQDCQSMCSEQLDECRGLLLCTYHTGCRCAPGYFGNTCNNSCLDGWYGNDCSLSCNCAPDSRCDIYTGKCEVCSLGYVPPYCLQEFVYCAASPVLSSMEYNTISVEFDANNVLGLGTPILYQLQYRQEAEEWRTYTIKLIPNDKSNIYETIIGLENGHIYEIRVLLIDSNFNKYDGPLVKASRIVTKCDIPEYYNYNVQSKFNISSVFLTWTYLNTTENWCPLEYFEVSWKENLLWRSRRTTAGNFTLGHLPGASIIFRVRAKTTAGFAPYSTQFAATNMSKGLQSVEQLRIVSIQFSSVELSWLPPSDHMGRSIQYKINYECVNRPACSLGCGDSQKGELSQTDTSLTLSYLLPFTQYRVTVTPEGGHRSSILVGTKGAVPSEIPTASSRPALCTNTSLTVFWEPVPVCSSFLRGYNYQLVKESESMKVLASGFTRNTNVTFSNLAVSSEYVVKVFIVNAAGVNPLAYLTINASRSATAPEAVRNLTVYKASRNMVGLRWAEPQATDLGPLQSFTVSVEGLAEGVLEKRVEPVHCAAWPELYCYTVDRLRPNKKYNFTVSARSRKVPEDWFPATIVALTKESYPTAPEHLQIVNVTAHDVLLRWQHPNLANGVIRSFLVNIEETDTFIQERCCQNFPIVEVNVNSEVEEYEAEVTGLRPASTYFMSVTAKTVGLGPSQSLSVTTRPPALPLTVTPPTSLVNATSWYQQDSGPTPTDDPGVYHALVKAHLLIHTYNSSSILPLSTATGIRDEQLDAFLKQIISTRFQFFAEYNQDGEVTDSKWGDRAFDEVVTGQPVAVQVTEYSGVYNADLAYSRGDTL